MKSVNFPYSAALGAAATPRPEGDLLLLGPKGSLAFGFVVVDSGADYVVLPEKAGLGVGLTLPRTPTTTLNGVGGSVGAALVRGVDVEFQRWRIKIDVMFDYSNGVRPLFGRSGIRALQDIGMDRTDWHWNP